jgi:hypothetical protein
MGVVLAMLALPVGMVIAWGFWALADVLVMAAELFARGMTACERLAGKAGTEKE